MRNCEASADHHATNKISPHPSTTSVKQESLLDPATAILKLEGESLSLAREAEAMRFTHAAHAAFCTIKAPKVSGNGIGCVSQNSKTNPSPRTPQTRLHNQTQFPAVHERSSGVHVSENGIGCVSQNAKTNPNPPRTQTRIAQSNPISSSQRTAPPHPTIQKWDSFRFVQRPLAAKKPTVRPNKISKVHVY